VFRSKGHVIPHLRGVFCTNIEQNFMPGPPSALHAEVDMGGRFGHVRFWGQ
jgi:hypothetical protein